MLIVPYLHHHFNLPVNPASSFESITKSVIQELLKFKCFSKYSSEKMSAICSHEEEQVPPPTISYLMMKKFITGYFGGVVSSVCSHPFDLIKSRVQSGQFPNIKTTIVETYKKEGPLAFYKGVTAPISVAGLFSAVLFASNEIALKFLTWLFHPPHHDYNKKFFDHSDLPLAYIVTRLQNNFRQIVQ